MSKSIEPLVMAALRRAIAGLGVLGSAVDFALDRYLQQHREESIRVFSESLTRRINRLEVQLRHVTSTDGPLYEIMNGALLVCMHTQHEVKLRAAANVLVNEVLRDDNPERCSHIELELFLRAIDTLSIGSFDVLGKIYTPQWISDLDRSDAALKFDFRHVTQQSPELDASLLLGLTKELERFGLVRQWADPVLREYRYANLPFETTKLGFRFVKFIVAGPT